MSRIESEAVAVEHPHRRSLALYLREERPRAVGLAILLLASQLVPLAEPLLLKGFVDRATAGEALAVLIGIALAYIGVALVAQVLAVVVSRAGTILAWRVTDRMRSDVADARAVARPRLAGASQPR